MAIELSLTQFLTYSSKVSTSAKINYIRQVKNSEYDPSVDYWKKSCDEIKKTHEKNLPIEDLLELPKRVSEKRQKIINEQLLNTFLLFEKIMLRISLLENPFGLILMIYLSELAQKSD